MFTDMEPFVVVLKTLPCQQESTNAYHEIHIVNGLCKLQKGYEGFRLLLWFSTTLRDDKLQPSSAMEDNSFVINCQGQAFELSFTQSEY